MENWNDVFRSETRWSERPAPSYTGNVQKRYNSNESVHKPLVPELEDFRLVLLQPSPDYSAPIECNLKHAAFTDCIPYEALSYVWGDPSKTVSITLDGKKQEITVNLEEALRHIRQTSEARTLWIDALSINQNNLAERSQQVALMQQIYSSCTADLLWLSKADEELERGFQLAANLEHAVLSATSENLEDDQFNLWSIKRPEWRSLQKLFVDLDVWHRVWVMQEISCAPRVILMLGTKTLDWEVFERFLGRNHRPDAFHSPFSHSQAAYPIYTTLTGIQVIEHQRDIVREMKNEGYKSRLIDVLSRFRFTQATDPRDKIYGLLGLASDTMGVRVDYSKSVRDVYVDIFRAYTDTTQNLDLLCQSQWGVSDVSISGERVPSWCPDFSRSGETVLLFAQRSIFCAGREQCHVPCDINANGQLKLNGISLGPISSFHAPITLSISSEVADFETLVDFASKEESDELSSVYKPTGEDIFQAYWRTIIADCKIYPTERLGPSDIAAISDYKAVFEEWHRDQSGYEMKTSPPQGQMMWKMKQNWRFALNQYGFYCMVPHDSEVGDEIVVLHGGKVPMVIRPVSGGLEDQCYKVVGTAYVHGFMDGEAMSWQESGKLKARDVILV